MGILSPVWPLPYPPILAALKMTKIIPNIMKSIAMEMSTDGLRVLNILIFGWTANQILINLISVVSDMIKASVYGQLIDRYLFNFRLDADYLESRVPVDWLKPRLYHGYGVVSFCLLKLKGVTLWPLPTSMGIDSISCAYRCAVMDASSGVPAPSVYILGRSTNVPIVGKLGTALFSGDMQLMHASIEERPRICDIRVSDSQGKNIFVAQTKHSADLKSKLFGSVDEFVTFIKGGLSSYTPSTHSGKMSRVDLVEDSNTYRPIDAHIDYTTLNNEWKDSGLEFDSAFHASGGLYRLAYRGTIPAQTPTEKVERLTKVWHEGQVG